MLRCLTRFKKQSDLVLPPAAIIHPYMNLQDRISQLWINRYTVILVLLAIKIFLFHKILSSDLRGLELVSRKACGIANKLSTDASSVPHYAAIAANNIVYSSVEQANRALNSLLSLILTGTESLLVFYVELMIGTYACLLTAAVDSGVDIATNSTEAVIRHVNNTLTNATQSLTEGLSEISKVISNTQTLGESMIDLLTGSKSKDTPVTSLNHTIEFLENLSIPSSINTDLSRLADKSPDFSTLKNKTKGLLSGVFDIARDHLKKDLIGEATSIAVPAIESAQVCSKTALSNDFEDVIKFTNRASIAILGTIIAMAILILAPLTCIEYRRWRIVVEMCEEVSETSRSQNSESKIFVVLEKYTHRVGFWVSSRLSSLLKSSEENHRNAVHWLVAYSTSNNAVLLLQLGLLGIVAVVLQYLILSVASEGLQKAENVFSQGGTQVKEQLLNMEQEWSNSTNSYLSYVQDSINSGTLGMINNVTSEVNTTIAGFYEGIETELSTLFNKTVFEKPVKAVVRCVIGNKVESIEKGLTWVHDQAKVSLPRVNQTLLGDVNRDSSPDSLNKLKELVSDLGTGIVEEYKKSIKTELIISLLLISLFVLQLIIGLVIIWLRLKCIAPSKSGFHSPKDLPKPQTVEYDANSFSSNNLSLEKVTRTLGNYRSGQNSPGEENFQIVSSSSRFRSYTPPYKH